MQNMMNTSQSFQNDSVLIGDKNTLQSINKSVDNGSKNTHGITGIMNLGNTCYMNSALQALSHNYLLINYLFMNKKQIIRTLLTNARKIFKDCDNFKTESTISPIPLELRKKIQSENYHLSMLTVEDVNILLNNTITAQIIRLFECMWKNNCVVVPTSFRKVFGEVRDKFFFGYEQHDAEEAYSCIIQKMQEELAEKRTIRFKTTRHSVGEYIKYMNDVKEKVSCLPNGKEKDIVMNKFKQIKKQMPRESLTAESFREMKKYYEQGYSYITEIFSGYVHSSICCPNTSCGFTNDRFDAFTHLSLSIPVKNMYEQLNVYDCLREYFSQETLDADNLWNCEGCHEKVQAIKKTKLWTTPYVLVIQFKRFGMTRIAKDNRFINYPMDELDVSSVICSQQFEDSVQTKYKLQCVINHHGGLNNGHYFTYSKIENTGEWYEFNDTYTGKVADNHIVNQNAYILFYIRSDLFRSQ
ncbi:putative ubiquitin-specific protease [Acanthamoeba polyphaga mimivirus]|nr:putative ubiquitin-specific protease [Mimivirus reunion]WMV61674.1 putative ubiquitin-specific protease [Mimivirus sp.]WMV62651.1 putative ubiquitin-specific protease [Acanthamoeba polyphaga mimivirus]WMV63628.1 putative ubiquitin-specific protease [Mimivirus sp.]